MSEPITTYAEFWPYYLREHSHPGSRALHDVGSICGLASLAAAVLVSPWFLLVGLVVGYGPAWIGHFVVEKNKPATFGHPFWSLISDYRMFGPRRLASTGIKSGDSRSGSQSPAHERELSALDCRISVRACGSAGARIGVGFVVTAGTRRVCARVAECPQGTYVPRSGWLVFAAPMTAVYQKFPA